jgi:7-alpha-hydroxysteroid dehydrogenase
MTIFDLFRLDGDVALITGGGGGLGSAIARAFADAGADVAVVGRSLAPLQTVRADVERRGRRCAVITGDVTDARAAEAMVCACIERLGKLTILVNNVGGLGGKDERPLPAMELSEESWTSQIDLNLNSVWRLTKVAVPRMSSGGVILNMSSIKAFRPDGGSGAYGAAKAALNNLTLALSKDLAPKFRVNAIAPGPVPTDAFMNARNVTEADFPSVAKEWGIPLGRLGRPDDVASTALFLASPAGSWITGQTILVAGGM